MRLLLFVLSVLFSHSFFAIEKLKINEFNAINTSIIKDEYGEYDDWIELYNYGEDSINLKGFYISNKLSAPQQFKFGMDFIIPPRGYTLLWADNQTYQGKNHLNFKLSGYKDEIALYNSTLELIDSISFEAHYEDYSYGRFPNGAGFFNFFSPPTPGKENKLPGFSGVAAPPGYSLKAGAYQGRQIVELIPNSSGDPIYFTLNGDNPSKAASIYTSPLSIDKTTIVRAISVHSNYLPSSIAAAIYFINERHALPVMSIIIDSVDMFGQKGIYTNPEESGDLWKRACQVFYFKEGNLEFGSSAGISIQGGNSVGMPKKAFRLFYQSKYGQNKLNYPLFKNSKVQTFKNLVLRAGYDDDISTPVGTLIKDPFVNLMFRNSGGWCSYGNWAALTINNEYWGIYNIRESVNKYSIGDHTGYTDFDLIRYKKKGPELKNGTMQQWDSLTAFINTADFTKDSVFYVANKIMDMENFVNLLANVHVTENKTWTWGTSAYKEKSPQGKWRWTIWDMDRSMYILDWNGFEDYADLTGTRWPNFMISKLLESQLFQNQLINRTADLLNTLFLPDLAGEKLDSIKAIVYDEMPNEIKRWSPDKTLSIWEEDINKLHEFLTLRPKIVRDQIEEHFNLNAQVNISLAISPPGAGRIKINTITLNELPWEGIYFDGVPVTLTVMPNSGFTFSHWAKNNFMPIDSNTSISINISSNDTIQAVFTGEAKEPGIVFSELNYHSSPALNAGDWIELYNYSNFDLDLSGWYLKDSDSSRIYSLPLGTVISSKEYLVLYSDSHLFKASHPNLNKAIGPISFSLKNDKESIRLFDNLHREIIQLHYSDSFPWPREADGYGKTLELMDFMADLNDGNNWFSGCLGGSPGKAFEPCTTKIIFSEVNYHSPKMNDASDWVEIHNLDSAEIDISRWVLKDKNDSNSFHVPANTIIPALGYLVLTNNNFFFSARHPKVSNFIGPFNFNLSNDGDMIRLYDESEILKLSMEFRDTFPWPKEADGNGMTLELKDPLASLSRGSNWFAGCTGGSPGMAYAFPCDSDSSGNSIKPNLIFTEVNYDDSSPYNSGDWIEVQNLDTNVIDLSGWIINDDTELISYSIPYGTLLHPGAYLIICQDTSRFKAIYSATIDYIGDFTYELSHEGGGFSLKNVRNAKIISMHYKSSSPWPDNIAGSGRTLEISDLQGEMNDGANWFRGCPGGSAGTSYQPGCKTEIKKWKGDSVQILITPNPSTNTIHINLSGSVAENWKEASLMVFDINSVMVMTIDKIGTEGFILHKKDFPAGIYTIKINHGNTILTEKIVFQ